MTGDLEYYVEGTNKVLKRTMKQLTVWDIGAIKVTCLFLGMLIASWFPRLTKKLKPLLALVSLILIVPVIIKVVRIVLDVFRIRIRLK